MPFSIKRFTMHRSTSLPGGRSSEGKKISLTEIREHPNSSRSGKKSDKNKSGNNSSSSTNQQQQQQQQQGGIPNSRSMDVSELRRLGFGNPRQGPPPELLADAMASAATNDPHQQSSSSSSSSSSTMDRTRRTLHSIQEHPIGSLRFGQLQQQQEQQSPRGGGGNFGSIGSTATLPARWKSSLPPRPASEMRGNFNELSSSGSGGNEVRRLVVRKNGVRFQESDWSVDDNHSLGNNKVGGRGGGGPPTLRAPSSALSKRPLDCDSDSGHMSDVLPRGSQTLKRPQPRRHHTVGFETGSMTTLPRPSLDLESHLPNQRSHSLYQPPPSSVYDDDPGIMSEVETSATGFRRASKARASLPIVRTPSKTQERPLGLVFLQYQSETKRALLPNEITSMDTVKALFVRSFPKQLTMQYLDSPHIRVYIHDPAKDMFYELEDLRDIRDRSVLRIYEQDVNGGGVYSTYDQDLSYFSEPEFDSEYQHQHIHRSKGSKAPLPPAIGYYGTLPTQYLPANRTQTLPHSASMRTYSPTHATDRQKSQTLPPGGGGTQPPPKPQRSFQQTLTPLGKTVRSTPPPTGPPPSIPSPRSGQPRPLVPVGSTMPMSPERRHEPLGSYRAPPDRPYSVAGQATYHISPERRYDPPYHSSPERRSQQESGYLSSPERRVDHQQSFSGYSPSSSYEDSVYGGSIYGTRSGSVTPVIDEEARLRMEYMERQLASLTGLVQKALTTGPPNKNQQPQQQQLQQIPTRDCDLAKDRSSAKVHLTPEMYVQLRHLRKQTKDLRLEVRNLRRIAQAQSVTARDTVRETCIKIKSMLASAQAGEDQVCAERLRVSREEDLYRQDVTKLEKDLTELETHVEELRSNVINRKCRVNMSDVEGMALVLSRASKTVADLKARFPNLQESLKSVMAAEMEVVVREEKFLKEEPDRLETALRRCKKLTGTLVTLKRLASVQEQRNTGAHPPAEKSSSEGNHSDGEVHSVKTITSDPHTVIHVPPGGHQRASENALDALLDELQTFTKPLEQPRDNIPGLLGPQRRLPSYPSAESPVRSPARSFAPSITGPPEVSTGNSAFKAPATITSKLQVTDAGQQRTVLSPSHSPVPDSKKSQDMIIRVAVNPGGNTRQTVIDGVEGTITNPIAHKKAPPPPPPRTTSRSPLTSPTSDSQESVPGSPRDVVFSQLRSNSAPACETDSIIKRMTTTPRSVSKDEGTAQKEKEDEELLRTSAISDDALRREQLSSNSSSSESVNSQEGLQVSGGSGLSPAGKLERKSSGGSSHSTPPDGGTPTKNSKKLGPPTPPRSRSEVLEQRHQELLRKQKHLQDQYTRLQQLQRGQLLQRFSPPRSATSTPILNDLKKTGSESNILSKSSFSLTPSSGSLTHLAGTAVSFTTKQETKPSAVITTTSATIKAPAVPAKPTTAQITKNKIYETDIL